MKKLLLLLLVFVASQGLIAQCGSWEKSANKDELENYHVIYRQFVKSQNYDAAFDNWKKVFDAAPAADGQRDIQYLDGIELYKHRFGKATTAEEKEAAKKAALAIYDQLIKCYESNGIPCQGENCVNKKLAFVYGRKAFDMYYTFNAPYDANLEAIQKAIEYGGNENEYVIFAPGANIAVYQFQNNLLPKEKVVELYTKLNEIADYQINNNADLSAYFTQAKENMNGTFATIEDQIFDCDYFKEKFQPEFESDPDNPVVLKKLILTLKSKGCADDDEFMVQLNAQWQKYAAEENERIQSEYEANNPAYVAKKLYEEGKFGEAIAKYDEAISAETDNEKKALLLFGKASIQFRKLGQYGTARATAYEAARLKPNWGRPYMLIGDMYGKSASSCGDSWTQRLAIIAAIDKYAYARSIDGDVSSEASSRIGSYSRSLPDQEMGFMRGIKEGQSASVGCWIGETVRVRYK